MTKLFIIIFIILNILTSCNNIETGDSLDKKTKSKIKEIGLLDENEKILKYYSNYDEDKAGNFYTNLKSSYMFI